MLYYYYYIYICRFSSRFCAPCYLIQCCWSGPCLVLSEDQRGRCSPESSAPISVWRLTSSPSHIDPPQSHRAGSLMETQQTHTTHINWSLVSGKSCWETTMDFWDTSTYSWILLYLRWYLLSHHTSHRSRHRSRLCRHRPAAAPRSHHEHTSTSLVDTLYQVIMLWRQRNNDIKIIIINMIILIHRGQGRHMNGELWGTHRAERSLQTPAGLRPHRLFAPRSDRS